MPRVKRFFVREFLHGLEGFVSKRLEFLIGNELAVVNNFQKLLSYLHLDVVVGREKFIGGGQNILADTTPHGITKGNDLINRQVIPEIECPEYAAR